MQTPRDGEEWPFVSDYGTDMASKPNKRANARLASDLSRPGIERPWNVAGSDGLDLLGAHR